MKKLWNYFQTTGKLLISGSIGAIVAIPLYIVLYGLASLLNAYLEIPALPEILTLFVAYPVVVFLQGIVATRLWRWA
jgi:hypothetical protein